jgi:hypothetical protein
MSSTRAPSTARFREAVVLALRAEGIDATADPVRPQRDPSDLDADARRPDVEGLGAWFLNTTTSEQARLGSHVDRTRRAAALAGQDRLGATVVYRRGRPISDAYVIVSLADFARVLDRETLGV